MIDARSRLIVALDVPDRAAALEAVNRLRGHAGCFKLGLEVFVAEGPSLVEEIAARGEKVFLDLKFHDIPNTVAAAVRAAARLGVQMLTVHASGGTAMLSAALEASRAVPNPPLLLAVTALTSLSQMDADRLGVSGSVESWVGRLAESAHAAGIRAFVASAREAPALRTRFGRDVQLVVPGIRPTGTSSDDQSRTATPGEAIRRGADYLVVGRPILQAADPALAASRVVEEIAGAVAAPAPIPDGMK